MPPCSTRTPAIIRRSLVRLAFAAAFLTMVSGSAIAAAPSRRATVDPRLAVAVAAGRPITALAMLRAQADVSGAAHLPDKRSRGRFVFHALVATADAAQGPLRARLAANGTPFTPYYIVDAIAFDADAPTLALVAARDDVASVVPLVSFGWAEGASGATSDSVDGATDGPAAGDASPHGSAGLAVAERNLRAIGADKVWRQGFLGAGATVAIIDTGVNARHPALGERYRGKAEGDDYNWLDAVLGQASPVDVNDHGTHVAGIALGKQGSREIGVAPEAQWIACRIFAQDRGTTKEILDCLQWALAPTKRDGSSPLPDRAPDVINASWGTFGRAFCDNPFPAEGAIRNLVAAGILFVAAAGNEGPRCGSVCPPGSLLDSLTVGNYDDEHRKMADTSSRGPFVVDGVQRIKPDLAAPGENINSSIGTSQYAVMQGTSMAAPHVTGAAALLISVRPSLAGHPAEIRALLEANASPINADQCGPSGARTFNNSAGHGVLDIAAAVDALLALPTATPAPTSARSPTVTTAPSATRTMPPTAGPTRTASTTPPSEASPTTGPTLAPSATARQGGTPTAPAAARPTVSSAARIYLPRADRGALLHP